MLTHWLNFFTVTKRISGWHHFCKWKFLYLVNSASGSFCWIYVTDTLNSNYAGDNILQLCMFWGSTATMQVVLSVTVMLVDLSVAITYMTVSVKTIQLKVCAALIWKWQFLYRMRGWQLLLYLCRRESLLQLCKWYVLQCTTVSFVKSRLLFLL